MRLINEGIFAREYSVLRSYKYGFSRVYICMSMYLDRLTTAAVD